MSFNQPNDKNAATPNKSTKKLNAIANIALLLSVGSLGLFAGAMLTEGCVLVPYWRSLKPPEFFAWYAANGQRLLGFFGPLTTAAGLISLATALFFLWQGHAARWLMLLAAVAMVAAASTFYVYSRKRTLVLPRRAWALMRFRSNWRAGPGGIGFGRV